MDNFGRITLRVSNPFEQLRPTGPLYARMPILQAFNWSECLSEAEPRQWYVVAFRSIRSPKADPALLKALDDRAYEEAMKEPGLLLYFRGAMTERRECLSICIWESVERAQAATRLPSHQAAADITDEMYELFELERWILSKRADVGRVEVRPVSVAVGAAARYASAVTQESAIFWMNQNDGGTEAYVTT